MELEVVARHNLIRPLRFGILKEAAVAVANLTIERRLVVDTTRQTENRLILFVVRLVGDTCPRADIHLFIIAPIIGPDATRDDQLAFVLNGQVPCILHKAIKVVEGKPIVRLVHEIHADFRQHDGITANHVGDMRQTVACRVHHLPFVHHIIDFLMLEAETPFQQTFIHGIKTLVVKVIDLGIETVAGVFGLGADFMVFDHFAKTFRADRSVADAEEILFLKVESFSFVGRIGRGYPSQVQVFIRLIHQGQSTKSSGVVIDFLTIKEHVDLQGDIYGSRIDFGVLRNEHVAVLGEIAQERQAPFIVELVIEQGLGIGEVGSVIALGVHHAEC